MSCAELGNDVRAAAATAKWVWHGNFEMAKRWPAALPQDSEGAGDWDDRLDECRWVTVCEDIWHTGPETSMHD